MELIKFKLHFYTELNVPTYNVETAMMAYFFKRYRHFEITLSMMLQCAYRSEITVCFFRLLRLRRAI